MKEACGSREVFYQNHDSPVHFATVSSFFWVSVIVVLMTSPGRLPLLLACCLGLSEAGPRFVWHRAWGMAQDAKKGKRPKSKSQVLAVACTEDYCKYSTSHKCTLDCIIPQSGCRQFCDQNEAKDARDYICPDGIVFGKGGERGNPTCFPNGYPVTNSKPDGCCTYFQCSGTGKGKCDPREIFDKCMAESESGSNPKLTGSTCFSLSRMISQ
jgi:hypothetical protein